MEEEILSTDSEVDAIEDVTEPYPAEVDLVEDMGDLVGDEADDNFLDEDDDDDDLGEEGE